VAASRIPEGLMHYNVLSRVQVLDHGLDEVTMKLFPFSLSFALSVFLFAHLCNAGPAGDVTVLNHEGVVALKKNEWQRSFQKFKAALKIDPQYEDARQNLAIAHNNYALHLAAFEGKVPEALREFHQALYIQPDPTIVANLNGLLKKIGKDPNNFADRMALGEQAVSKGEFVGAVIEYSAALEIQDDPNVHQKLGKAYELLNEHKRAKAEYEAASGSKSSSKK
jgi:tetratricopeptide (TPR) repeat protein